LIGVKTLKVTPHLPDSAASGIKRFFRALLDTPECKVVPVQKLAALDEEKKRWLALNPPPHKESMPQKQAADFFGKPRSIPAK
jgi:hypothetical protein